MLEKGSHVLKANFLYGQATSDMFSQIFAKMYFSYQNVFSDVDECVKENDHFSPHNHFLVLQFTKQAGRRFRFFPILIYTQDSEQNIMFISSRHALFKSYQPSVQSQGQLKRCREVAKAGIDGISNLQVIDFSMFSFSKQCVF